MAVQVTFDSLTVDAADANNDAFQQAVKALDKHFKVEPNHPFERYNFRQLHQQAGETVDQFAARLRTQAANCGFVDTEDQIRDQLIERITDGSLRRKLLETPNIKLAAVLQTARTWEATRAQAKGMSASAADNSINALESTPKSKDSNKSEYEGKACTNCGRRGHHAKDKSCPAKGKVCRNCQKSNHFAKQCRSKFSSANSPSRPSSHQQRSKRSTAHHIAGSPDSDDEYAFTVNAGHSDLARV